MDKISQTYRNMQDLTGINQAGPTMFSAYRSESPVKNLLSTSVRKQFSLCRSIKQFL